MCMAGCFRGSDTHALELRRRGVFKYCQGSEKWVQLLQPALGSIRLHSYYDQNPGDAGYSSGPGCLRDTKTANLERTRKLRLSAPVFFQNILYT